jgi:hypothetical protein
MNLKSKEILSKKLDFIFDYMTQQELSISLDISQWILLEKIKDNSFNKKELKIISKIYRDLYLQQFRKK